MSARLMDLSWAFTQRFFMAVGALWMFTTLIGPRVSADFLILGSAAVTLVSLLVDRPKSEALKVQ